MNNEELKLEENKNATSIIEDKNVLCCPNCNERLIYMMPGGDTLYCKKCEKFFKNDNESVGEETTNPYKDENAIY